MASTLTFHQFQGTQQVKRTIQPDASGFLGFDANKKIVSKTAAAALTGQALTSPTVNTVGDTSGTVRLIPNPTAKTIVDGSATALFSVAVPALSGIGGVGHFLVRASDGTEFQADAGLFTYSAEAKTTTVVGTITYVAANEAKAVSSGTLTLAFTADVSVNNVVTYKVQPTGSLTETAPYTIEYTLFPIRGVVTIL
jgi:hypothetical protein